MAVPKCKVSKARRDKRRGSNWKLSAPSVAVCPKCGEPSCPPEPARLAVPTMAVRSWLSRLSKPKSGKQRKVRRAFLFFHAILRVPKAIFTKIALLNLYESTFLHCFCRKDVS